MVTSHGCEQKNTSLIELEMDFDPLLLFTPPPPKSLKPLPTHVKSVQISCEETLGSDHELYETDETDDVIPLHIHDLPLLQLKPPSSVLQLFLRMLAPDTIRNFEPTKTSNEGKTPQAIFAEKDVTELIDLSLKWLKPASLRFNNESQISSISILSESLKKSFPSEYNGWLTRIISSDLAWLTELEAEEVKKLASLRLAENCGRSAQPEFIREIEISHLGRNILLREPSLTADNLGLKTWGSSFILGSRLAADKEQKYLKGPVLELGSGTGLVGMVACVLGYPTILTDLKEILPNLKANVELNKIANGEVEELDWSDPSYFVAAKGSTTYNTIILSDPLYSSKHPAWIVNMMSQFLSQDPDARVLLQLPIRKSFENERADLWRLIEESGFIVQEEEYETGYDDFGETTFYFKKLVRCEI